MPLLGDAAIDGMLWLSLWLVLTDGAAQAYAYEHGLDVAHLRLFPRMDRYTGELRFDLDAEEWTVNASFVRAWANCGFSGKVSRHSMHAAALRRSFEMTGRFEPGFTLTRHVVFDHLDNYFKNALDPHRLGAALAIGGLTPAWVSG